MSFIREIQEKLSYQTKRKQQLQEEYDACCREIDNAPPSLRDKIQFDVTEAEYNPEAHKATPTVGDLVIDGGKVAEITELSGGKIRTANNYFEPEFIKQAPMDNPRIQKFAAKNPNKKIWIHG